MKKNNLIITCISLSIIYLLWGIHSISALQYILTKRILRLIAVYIIAYMTSVSTIYFQSIASNNILTPSILGVDKIYLLIQIIITSLLGVYISSTSNFIISILIMVTLTSFTYSFILKVFQHDIFKMMLLGIVGGTLIQSIITTLGMMMDPNEYSLFQSYSIASLNDITLDRLLITCLLLVPILFLKKSLDSKIDIIGLGNSWAQNYGVDIEHYQKLSLILISSLSALTTALIGPNLFLGLIIVSLARKMILNYSHQLMIGVSTLIGIGLLLISQIVLERILGLNGSLGFGISIIGGLVFCITLFKETRL